MPSLSNQYSAFTFPEHISPGHNTGHNEAGAVTQGNILGEDERLEVFRLSWCFRYADFFRLQANICSFLLLKLNSISRKPTGWQHFCQIKLFLTHGLS